MEIQGVIFDFNGTLFKDGEYHVQAWQQISKELTGIKMSREEIQKQTHGVCNEVTIDRLSQGRLTKAENRAWSLKKEALYRQMVMNDKKSAALVPGAKELFETLRQHRIPFVIASASIDENIDFFFDFFQLDQWFSKKETIYDDGTYPDKRAMFEAALNTLGSDRQQTMIFEDSDSGLRCAIDSGFDKIVMIADDPQRKTELESCPEVVACLHDFTEFLPLLEPMIDR